MDTTEITRFEVAGTYELSAPTCHTWKTRFTVIDRTARFVTLHQAGEAEPIRKGIYVYNGAEHTRPYGSYSMNPIVSADRPAGGDRHGNYHASEGLDLCPCGVKYWENDRCVDCGARFDPKGVQS